MHGHLACMRYALCRGSRARFYKAEEVRLRAAIQYLADAWLKKKTRKAAASVIGEAWLEFTYRPGGAGASRVGKRYHATHDFHDET